MHEVAGEMGRGKTYNKAPVGVYFGTPGVEADDPYFGGEGPRRRGCISCGNCMIGCGHNAKNKLTVNYLYLARSYGADDSRVAGSLRGQTARRRRVRGASPTPGVDAAGCSTAVTSSYTAAQVIVSAHAYSSAKLLHHLQTHTEP